MTKTDRENLIGIFNEKIEFAKTVIVIPPNNEIDRIANSVADDFIKAYEEAKRIIGDYPVENCE